MIVARSSGQFGNQMFLVAAAASRMGARENFVGFGFAQLDFVTEGRRSRRIHLLPRLSRRAVTRLTAAAELLRRVRMIGSFDYAVELGSRSISRKNGLLPIWLWSASFPHQEHLFDAAVVKQRVLQNGRSAHTELSGKSGNGRTIRQCFVHMRRGDFLVWPSPEKSAALPDQWFVDQMRRMVDLVGDCEFVILSDDVDSVLSEHFQEFRFEILELNIRESFEVMAQCDAGILSPSTYSWWGAWEGYQAGNGPYFAPLFWNNWREENWKPYSLRGSFLTYIPVQDPNV